MSRVCMRLKRPAVSHQRLGAVCRVKSLIVQSMMETIYLYQYIVLGYTVTSG